MIPRKEKKYPGKHNMHLPVLRLTSQMPSFQCYFYEKADLPAMIKYGMNKLQQISQYLKPQTNFSTNMCVTAQYLHKQNNYNVSAGFHSTSRDS